jgi:hypothetical protein
MTIVTGVAFAAAAHCEHLETLVRLQRKTVDDNDTMKWLELPTGEDKPAWSGLFGAVSLAYLFWDPYRNGASWGEWISTGVAFVVFLGLITLGLIYWSRPRVLVRVCIAMS